jgi:MYXO-CTERM domain-containing protein
MPAATQLMGGRRLHAIAIDVEVVEDEGELAAAGALGMQAQLGQVVGLKRNLDGKARARIARRGSLHQIGEIVAHTVGAGIREHLHLARVLVEHHVAVFEVRQQQIQGLAEQRRHDGLIQRTGNGEEEPDSDEGAACSHHALSLAWWCSMGMMVHRGLLVGAVLSVTVAAGCGVATPTGERRAAITNGSADPGDPAVVMVVGSDGSLVCSGVVIGAHTVLTAAHCRVDDTNFDGFSVQLAPSSTPLPLAGADVHPMYDANSFENDLELLTLRDATSVPPLPLDSRTPDDTWVGQSFTVVGFGATSGATMDWGQKRSGTSKVTSVAALDFEAAPDPAQPCAGDSGGPALFSAGGVIVVSGISSHGDEACDQHAYFARVDVAQGPFLQPYFSAISDAATAVGERCYFDAQCVSGSCLTAGDDEKRAFCGQACARDRDCPAPMICSMSACRYRAPSPGALGAKCAQASDCADGVCDGGLCTRGCVPAGVSCPSGFECVNTADINFYCKPAAASSSGCALGGAGGSGGWWWLVLLAIGLHRRRTRCDR